MKLAVTLIIIVASVFAMWKHERLAARESAIHERFGGAPRTAKYKAWFGLGLIAQSVLIITICLLHLLRVL